MGSAKETTWGMDADYLKEDFEILSFVCAGYTFFTVELCKDVVNTAGTDTVETLNQKVVICDCEKFSVLHLSENCERNWGQFNTEPLIWATVNFTEPTNK